MSFIQACERRRLWTRNNPAGLSLSSFLSSIARYVRLKKKPVYHREVVILTVFFQCRFSSDTKKVRKVKATIARKYQLKMEQMHKTIHVPSSWNNFVLLLALSPLQLTTAYSFVPRWLSTL